MNAEAHWLQAYDVLARDPNGLPAAHQHVSAYDEALIARRALAMPAFMRYDSTLAARFQVKRRKWVTLVNQNALLMSTGAASVARSAGRTGPGPPISEWPGGMA